MFLNSGPVDSGEYPCGSCRSSKPAVCVGASGDFVFTGKRRGERKRELGPTWMDPESCNVWWNHWGETKPKT